MTVIGFHASHEQVHPAELLRAVELAEAAGFAAGMCSDHFAPWSERQGHSGFAWSWLGAALASTTLPFGVVTAPGQRYHPAIVAQAAATLEAMFPGRFWMALGSGEAINEHITGDRWPRKELRDRRLEESARIIKALLAGAEVSHDGLVTVDRARLWTRPAEPAAVLGAAVTVPTAGAVASWADGMITLDQPSGHLKQMVETYRAAGGRGPLCVQVHLSWHPDQETALRIGHEQWRSNAFPPDLAWNLEMPAQFDAASAQVPPSAMHDHLLISSDPGVHAERIAELIDIGFDEVYLHHVGQTQKEFIEFFGEHVLPRFDLTGPEDA
ncbi:TIGR03885 family FMN-dependent LLM class oxidoreductase [Phytoactinopolyspora alkaliphila]|uniref:TIGR03885 family FMN-dependent LLM class oxidoreductase n=1 Tax=Phytoactinopolyspora alkaliphila TaxID=1783498 RepID=A0A6N9YHZ9_9ACTN|nr:TIGR03885 family FMN-dependent LLM class oxidoreductase [Phytoactinopolyspora alkaliphila]